MQRWARSYGHAYQGMTGDRSDMIQDSEGEWVKFAEAEAAIAAAREDALAAAMQRVEALSHALECVTRDENRNRPCNCLRSDALDAIKGDQP